MSFQTFIKNNYHSMLDTFRKLLGFCSATHQNLLKGNWYKLFLFGLIDVLFTGLVIQLILLGFGQEFRLINLLSYGLIPWACVKITVQIIKELKTAL